MPSIPGARASLDVVGSHFIVGPTVVLGRQAVNLLEGKLSLRRAISACPTIRSDTYSSFGLYHKSLSSFHVAQEVTFWNWW